MSSGIVVVKAGSISAGSNTRKITSMGSPWICSQQPRLDGNPFSHRSKVSRCLTCKDANSTSTSIKTNNAHLAGARLYFGEVALPFPWQAGKLEEKNTCFKGMFAGEFSIQSYFTHFVSISAKLSRQASPWFCSSLFYHIIAYHERASASHPATPNCSLNVRWFKSCCPWPLRRLGVRRNSITSAWWWWCWMPPPFQALGIRACPFPSWRRLQNAEVLALIRRLACCKIVLRSRQEQFCEDQHLKLSRHIKTTLLPRLLYLQNLSVLLLFWLSSNQIPCRQGFNTNLWGIRCPWVICADVLKLNMHFQPMKMVFIKAFGPPLD